MLEPQEEYTLAKSWCEYGDRDAGTRLVTSVNAGAKMHQLAGAKIHRRCWQ
jgi:hypothetical protein